MAPSPTRLPNKKGSLGGARPALEASRGDPPPTVICLLFVALGESPGGGPKPSFPPSPDCSDAHSLGNLRALIPGHFFIYKGQKSQLS